MTDDTSLPAYERADAQAGGARLPSDLDQSIGIAGPVGAEATVGSHQPRTGVSILPAFDRHHTPSLDLIDDCVHCGFCLSTCPTYLLFGEEMDSPRGRIYLMREGIEGEPLNDAMVRHWDLCLGCLACVTACPSGVQYEKLIESTRQQVERRYPRSLSDRFFRELIYDLFPYPKRLAAAALPLQLYQRSGLQSLVRRSDLLERLPARVRAMERLLPTVPPRVRIPERTPARGEERQVVGMLTGCVQRVFFSPANAATVRVLAAEGCTVIAPARQGCCGALSAHVGREEEALRFARRTIDTFEAAPLWDRRAAGVESVAVNVAGCGSAMKEYGYWLRDDPAYAERAKRFSERVRDVSELLLELGPRAERRPLPLSVVYHDACHLRHGQGIFKGPRELLSGIPELELREVPREREVCCGSAGTYNLLEPDPAAELGERKARNVLEAGGELLVTGNPGCILQIQASLRGMGKSMPAAHIMEVLDASIRGLPARSLLR